MRPGLQIIGLVAFLLISFTAAGFGGIFTAAAIPEWYQTLPLPPWTPPNWLFGPVWTLLYTLMAIAAWLVWRRRGVRGAALPLALFLGQLLLNALWSYLFFGLRRPDLGLIDIVALWLAIAATTVTFWRVTPVAGALFVPYLVWVSYAATLNFAIVRAMG